MVCCFFVLFFVCFFFPRKHPQKANCCCCSETASLLVCTPATQEIPSSSLRALLLTIVRVCATLLHGNPETLSLLLPSWPPSTGSHHFWVQLPVLGFLPPAHSNSLTSVGQHTESYRSEGFSWPETKVQSAAHRPLLHPLKRVMIIRVCSLQPSQIIRQKHWVLQYVLQANQLWPLLKRTPALTTSAGTYVIPSLCQNRMRIKRISVKLLTTVALRFIPGHSNCNTAGPYRNRNQSLVFLHFFWFEYWCFMNWSSHVFILAELLQMCTSTARWWNITVRKLTNTARLKH